MSLLRHRDIARALLIEAKEDISSAKVLLDNQLYSRSISCCQHAIEKTLKAALAMKDIIITTAHAVSGEFLNVYKDWDKSEEIKRLAQTLEREGTKTEYPLFRRAELPIWIPSKSYNEQDAEDALSKANYIFKIIAEYLMKVYQIEIDSTID